MNRRNLENIDKLPLLARFCRNWLDILTGQASPVPMRLPSSAREFERVIGRDLTLKLATLVKQRRIYIPARPMTAEHPIAQMIGTDAAEHLRRAFGGSLMPLGRCRSAIRSKSIASSWVQGWTTPDLARAHGVSQRTVERALGSVTTRDVAPPPPPGIGSSEGGGMRVRRGTQSAKKQP